MKKVEIKKKIVNGFTLVELLVVISIIGILIGVSIFGLSGAREGSRDAKRKADLELIRSGIEIYKADCNTYPTTLVSPLVGDDALGIATCASSNTYIETVPSDPADPSRTYLYSSTGSTYEICASLEQETGSISCGGSTNCGETCNYRVTSP